MELTQLQERVLLAAAGGDGGRLIFWMLGSGRCVLPAFSEDVADTLRALEGAGLLASVDESGNPARAPKERRPGSHVMALTDAGRSALRSIGLAAS